MVLSMRPDALLGVGTFWVLMFSSVEVFVFMICVIFMWTILG